MQTLGEHHELKSDMLDNEEYIIANIKEKDPKKKELKIIKWFMFNEVSSYPIHIHLIFYQNGNKVKKEGGIKVIRFKVGRTLIKLLLLVRKNKPLIIKV